MRKLPNLKCALMMLIKVISLAVIAIALAMHWLSHGQCIANA
ncbi:MAG: hypothetical protein RBS43_07840 [Candidatus Cloacimonas sp.]|nr:hypothetical protein [Candidatus Cloacimonas sp.]